MALEMIPDRPGREAVFEPLLDELLALFSPDWVLPERMVGEHQHHRCEVKRWEIGRAAESDPDLTRRHAPPCTISAAAESTNSSGRW